MIENPMLRLTVQKKNGKRGMREPIPAEDHVRESRLMSMRVMVIVQAYLFDQLAFCNAELGV